MSRPSARLVYLIMQGGTALLFSLIWVAMPVYRIQVMGLNPFQLVILGTVLELTAFVFEIPTGVLADTHSRRLSVVVGILLLGAGFALEGIIPLFAVSLLCQVITGIGYTFISGAAEAWISDEIGEDAANHTFLRAAQVGQVGAIVGTLAGALLASAALNLPVVLGGALTMVLAVSLFFAMTERGFTPQPRDGRGAWQAMGATLRHGAGVVRVSPLLITILGIALIFGAYSEGFDRLWQAHFLKNFAFPDLGTLAPVVWFGIINVTAQLLSLAATEYARRRVDTSGHAAIVRALLAIHFIMMLGMVVFGLAADFWLGVSAYWVVMLMRITSGPLNAAWLNQNFDSSIRATVFSMRGQADALGQVIGGPIMGLIATVFSLRAVMVVAGLMLAPALLLYRHSLRRHGLPAAPGKA